MPPIVEVARFPTLIDAHRALEVLEEAGVEGDILDQNVGVALAGYVGALELRVVVREEDVERARAALASAPPRPSQAASAGGEDAEADGDAEDEGEAGPEEPALPPAAAETWAWKTRALAALGIVILLFAFVAALRGMRPPPGVAASPRARRMLGQARVFSWGAIVLWLLVTLGYAVL